MGIVVEHALGRTGKVFAAAQTVIGTPVWIAATDAMRFISCKLERSQNRKDREDKRQTRDRLTRFSGKISAKWELEKYISPSGTAGTAPDDDLLWTYLYGTATNTPATSQAYSLAQPQTPSVFSLVLHHPDSILERGVGCIVDEATINLSGTGEARVKFSGPCRDVERAGGTITEDNGTSSGSAAISLTANHGLRLFNGCRVQFLGASGRLTNSGAGYSVGSLGASAFTAGTVLEANTASPYSIWPFTPTETVAGEPLDGIAGSSTIAGSAVTIMSAEISHKNNLSLIDDNYGSAYLDDANLGKRDISGKLMLRASRDMVAYLIERGTSLGTAQFTTVPIVLVAGATAGSILTLNYPYAEIQTANLQIPDEDEVTFELPFVVRGSAGEDSSTAVFT